MTINWHSVSLCCVQVATHQAVPSTVYGQFPYQRAVQWKNQDGFLPGPVMLSLMLSCLHTRPMMLTPTAVLFMLGQWWWRLPQSCLYSASDDDDYCSHVCIRPVMMTTTAVMFVLGQWCWYQLQSCLYSASDVDAYCSPVYTRPVMLTPTAVMFILGQWCWRLLQSCLYSASDVDTNCSPIHTRPMMETPSAALLF